MVSVAGLPRIGFFAVFSRRPGNPIPADLLRYQVSQPIDGSSASRELSSSGRFSPAGAARDTPVVGAGREGEFWHVMARGEMTLDIAASRQDVLADQ